jgi:hypothetical protein
MHDMWEFGCSFYRFGLRRQHRCLTIYLGRRAYTWEWTR